MTDLSKLMSISSRDAFGLTLAELAVEDARVVALTADLAASVRLADMIKVVPERVFNFGIAEQDMMGASAGLALCGKIPFVTTFAVFAALRAAEQARTDIAYNGLPVRICATHGGIGLATGGATHHSLEDVAIYRNMPGMTVIVPADGVEAAAAVRAVMSLPGPSYIRLSRPTEPNVYKTDEPFVIGKARRVKTGKDLTIIAYGGSVGYSLKAAELLAIDGLEVGVIDMATIKPLDKYAIKAAMKESAAIMTVEEHNIIGGLGSAVAEVLAEAGISIPFKRHGIYDQFTTAGSYPDLLALYKLDAAGIASTVKEFLKK
ncbi:MAG TPA: transketolase C-terminal domain-containing protein [Leptolinea sp.]